MANGDVSITILDGGSAVTVPSVSIQAVIGVSSSGTTNVPIATQNPNTLLTAAGYGPGVEAAALTMLQGGTAIFVKAPTVSAGVASSVTHTGTGASVMTVTGTPLDDYFVIFKFASSGTVGTTTTLSYQLSLDAGRNYGPVLLLGAATTLAIPNTGLTLNFTAASAVSADIYQFGCQAPTTNVAGVTAALTALANSPFASTGWGSLHITGTWSESDAATISATLETIALPPIFVFTRAIISARDASPPVVYGGTAETSTAWQTSIMADYVNLSAKRICANAGFYNMPSAFPSAQAGAIRPRRPLSWALAAREVTIPPQRHAGRVSDGALVNIVIDGINDPLDGFVYYDQRNGGGLDLARFSTARTRTRLPGYFITNPNLMSPLGSVFKILPLGNVMDVGCTIAQEEGQQIINSDILLNPNGTISNVEATSIENAFEGQINSLMVATGEISSSSVSVDRTNNGGATSTVNVGITLVQKGYILNENITIGFANFLAAPVAGG